MTDPGHAASAITSEPDSLEPQPEQEQIRHHWRRRFTIAAVLLTLIAAAIILPPLVNIGRYKHQITALMTRSLGRPVRMSSVGLRLLPMPGFVLQDLSVSEDPRFGAEPVISAGTVIARVNLFALWSGKLEISRISVDEASLNLVRASDGRWNVDSLMLSAQPVLTGQSQSGNPVSRSYAHFPYLEATESRVNLKYGNEKMPYAVTAADLSLWQDSPGQWRFRLKGQPARTDIPMSSADAGELRAEGSLRSAPSLRDMPLSLQIEWREAQLGQLSRLLLGSDSGWRGDVTADIEVHGTVENAQTRARLRVLGIRREEFTPKTALNFEANCTLRYQHSVRAVHDLACDTDSGGGQIHLRADLPGTAGSPHGTLEVHDVPLQGGLDLLRAIRSDFAPGLSIEGKINGNLAYASPEQSVPAPQTARVARKKQSAKLAPPSPLRGELIVDGAKLEGDPLKEQLILPRMTWTPAYPASLTAAQERNSPPDPTEPGPSQLAMTTRFIVPISGEKSGASQAAEPPAAKTSSPAEPATGKPQAAPSKSITPIAAETPARSEAQALTAQLTLGENGYYAQFDGAGNISRLRELAYALGVPHVDAIDSLAGSLDQISLHATGPWLLSSDIGVAPEPAPLPPSGLKPAGLSRLTGPEYGKPGATAASSSGFTPIPGKDSFNGTATMRRATWSPSFLATPVALSQGILHLSPASLTFNSEFTFGAAKEPTHEAEPKAVKPGSTDTRSGPPANGGNATPEAPQTAISSRAVRGNVTVDSPILCAAGKCRPQVQLHFASLNTADLQSALLNAPQPKGFLAPLIDRMRSAEPVKLPDFDAEVGVDTLTVGNISFPFTAKLHPMQGDFVIDNWTANLFGGTADGTGDISLANGKPNYSLDGTFQQASGSSFAGYAGLHASGGQVSGNFRIQLNGLTQKDLFASAKGNLHFDWHGGTLQIATQPAISRFDDWSGDVALSSGKAEFGANTLVQGKQTTTISGSLTFGEPARLSVAQPTAKPEQK